MSRRAPQVQENIERFFTRFVEEGKATVRLREPAVDVCLSKVGAGPAAAGPGHGGGVGAGPRAWGPSGECHAETKSCLNSLTWPPAILAQEV